MSVEWYVYILQCADHSFYTGITTDVNRRFEEHNNNNRLAAKYTRSRRPVTLLYQETVDSKSAALKRELAIKALNRQQKKALIQKNDGLQDKLERLRPIYHAALIEQTIETSPELEQMLETIYLPLASWCLAQKKNGCLIIGINGAQGSGKSTLCHILASLLEQGFSQRTLILSIDDLYKTHTERKQLARDIHPLLQTRGVPGTHDTRLGIQILEQLKQAQNTSLLIPRFNKAIDDLYHRDQWTQLRGNIDIILFEGWCVGATAEDEANLIQPINTLEQDEDPDHSWRQFINQQLAGSYAELFSYIDQQVYLQIPGFFQSIEWRMLQEQKLRTANDSPSSRIMSDQEIQRFMMHYERISRHCMKTLPKTADLVLKINEQHDITEIIRP
ncbi:MAG: GIY-YIG nuclease family protein [Gammaproteobacteria bacterium]|nr:GIY-YIG nuclease family protein [Gammaproteobacteria bacterium]